jgi:hypothetical protein
MELHTADILDPDTFWEEELTRANQDLLFGCYIQQRSGSKATFVKGTLRYSDKVTAPNLHISQASVSVRRFPCAYAFH